MEKAKGLSALRRINTVEAVSQCRFFFSAQVDASLTFVQRIGFTDSLMKPSRIGSWVMFFAVQGPDALEFVVYHVGEFWACT